MIENLNTVDQNVIFYTYLAIGLVVLYLTTMVTFTFIINLRNKLKYSVYNVKRLWLPSLVWPILLLTWFIQWIIKKVKEYKNEK